MNRRYQGLRWRAQVIVMALTTIAALTAGPAAAERLGGWDSDRAAAVSIRNITPDVIAEFQDVVQRFGASHDLAGADGIAAIDLDAFTESWTAPDEAWARNVRAPENVDGTPAPTDRFVLGTAGITAVLDSATLDDGSLSLALHFSTRDVVASARAVRLDESRALLAVENADGQIVATQLVEAGLDSSRSHCSSTEQIGCNMVSAVRNTFLLVVCGGTLLDPLPLDEVFVCGSLKGSAVVTTAVCWGNAIACLTATPVPGTWEDVQLYCPNTDVCRFEARYVLAALAGRPAGDIFWTGTMTPDATVEYGRVTSHAVTGIDFAGVGERAPLLFEWSAFAIWWHSDVRCAFTVDVQYQANGSAGSTYTNKTAGSSYCF